MENDFINKMNWASGSPDTGHAPVVSPQSKISFYIDGFNLYYSLFNFCDNWIYDDKNKKRHNKDCNIHTCEASKYKWINLFLLCERIAMNHNFKIDKIQNVKLFTSKQDKTNSNYHRHELFEKMQNQYGCNIIHGRFDKNKGNKQEKETDMNIAMNVIEDVLFNGINVVFLMTNDSDFCPLIKFLKKNCKNIKLILYSPPKTNTVRYLRESMCEFYNKDIADFADLNKNKVRNKDINIYNLSSELMLQCPLPDEITINENEIILNPYKIIQD